VARHLSSLTTFQSNQIFISGMAHGGGREDVSPGQFITTNSENTSIHFSTQMGKGGVNLSILLARMPEANITRHPLEIGFGYLDLIPPVDTQPERKPLRAAIERLRQIAGLGKPPQSKK
jgi:hypothetical protein